MTGLSPEVSVLVIALGLVLALGCYLVTNLSPGGMITPGWLALAFIVQPLLAGLIIGVVVVTYLACQWLQRVVILYGKRLFATVVLVAVFLQLTAFLLIVQQSHIFYDATTLGFIVPGLVAYQLIRQPAWATITATAAVTMVAYCVTLAGILLRVVPIEEQVAASGIAASPSEPVSSLQLALSAGAVVLLLAIITVQSRRVRSAWEAAHPLRAARSLSLPPRFAERSLRAARSVSLVASRAARSVSLPRGRAGRTVPPRYRESLIIVASIAIAFALYFGFRTPDETQSHRQSYRPVAATPEAKPRAPVRVLRISQASRRSDRGAPRNRTRSKRATRIGANRGRRNRNRSSSVTAPETVAPVSTIRIENPPAASPSTPEVIRSVPAKTSSPKKRAKPQGFDDSG